MSRPEGWGPDPVNPDVETTGMQTTALETATANAAPRRLRGMARRKQGGTLAFVESPVQLLNVLEWAHQDAVSTTVTSA
ncbi:MAG: hypothetical protein ACRDP3_23005, partial [Streptomyces sp.]